LESIYLSYSAAKRFYEGDVTVNPLPHLMAMVPESMEEVARKIEKLQREIPEVDYYSLGIQTPYHRDMRVHCALLMEEYLFKKRECSYFLDDVDLSDTSDEY
jgi:hypothetical protein